MIPLRDNQPTSSFPIVTVLLIAANVIVYVLQQMSGGALDTMWTMVPYEVTHNHDIAHEIVRQTTHGPVALPLSPGTTNITLRPGEQYYGPSPHPLWLTIFSSMFMHGGLLHIGGNMLYLWIFGNNIEDALGKVRYLLFYLACGVLAAVTQIAVGPNSLIPTLGASGAIAGVLGAYFLLYPDARVLSIVPIFGFGFLAEVRAFWVLALWIGLQLFQGTMGLGGPQTGGVAYFAHIGGFAAGLLLITLLGGRRLTARQQTPYYRPPGY